MRIAFLERNTVDRGDMDLSGIESLGEVMYCEGGQASRELPQAVRDAEILLLNKTQVTEEFLVQCPHLRCICVLATGYNNIDMRAANAHGVAVYRVPGYSTDSVAQLTVGFLLQLAGSTFDYEISVQRGDWCRAKNYTYLAYPIRTLAGQTLGVIGYGAIGRRVAQIASAFGMRVIAHTRTVPKNEPNVTFLSLEELLKEADFVTLHCPLTEQTRNLINAERLSLMKPSAFLINTSRGPVVDENALAEALNSSKIAGAGIDVLDAEPMRKDCPLLGAKNCLITPHVGWAANEARRRLLQRTEQNIRDFLSGREGDRVYE